MAEEHGFQASESEGGHRLCVNNCGFFGSATTQNMCSKCYREICLQKSGDNSALFSTPLTAAAPSSLSSSSVAAAAHPIVVAISSPEKDEAIATAAVAQPPATAPQQPSASRCSACRKKVGLTGFRCRCGTTFCGTHRYPEKHGCTFDFKTVGREAIAKANPVVKADKLEKI